MCIVAMYEVYEEAGFGVLRFGVEELRVEEAREGGSEKGRFRGEGSQRSLANYLFDARIQLYCCLLLAYDFALRA